MEGEVQVVSPSIKPINKSAVHRICSGQVILDLSSAVKELVENSLDAGATSIEIALKDFGEESFKVIDNGCGISPDNFKVIALKHYTSKIEDFPDLQSLTTFGFRGEALSSLCTLGSLTVETRTKNEPMATHLTFDHTGLLTSERKKARQVGTTVTVEKLFFSLPVRSKEFSRNIRKEYGKLISLLNAYALIAKGVRFVCTNTSGKNTKSVVLKTQGSSSIKDNIITIFGMSTFSCLEPFCVDISELCKVEGFLSKPGSGSGRNLGDRQFYFVNGRPVDMPKLSKLVNELYRASNSRQYPIAIMNFTVPTGAYDVNVTPDKRKIFFSDEAPLLQSLREAIENIYFPSHCSYSANKIEKSKKENGSSELYICSKELQASLSSEGNVYKEDKSSREQAVKEQNEGEDASHVMTRKRTRDEHVEEHTDYKMDEKSTRKDFSLRAHTIGKVDASFAYTDKQPKTPTPIADKDGYAQRSFTAIRKGPIKHVHCSTNSSLARSSLTDFLSFNKRKHENSSTTLSELPILRNEAESFRKETCSEMRTELSGAIVSHNQNSVVNDISERQSSKCCREAHVANEDAISLGGNILDGSYKEEDIAHHKRSDVQIGAASDALTDTCPEGILHVLSEADTSITASDSPPLPSSGPQICSEMQFNIKDLKKMRQNLSELQLNGFNPGRKMIRRCFAAATLEISQPDNEERKEKALAAATSELERIFNKTDFGRMKVIGQFNLGFIIGKLDQDLFIIDQHAADEKHNFERLSESTILNQQPLLRPLRLELSPEEEIVAAMNMDIIRKNGFTLMDEVNAPPGHRFKLRAVPFSKNITFGAEDVKELISTLTDSQGECALISSYKKDTPDSLCPPRVRAMLASRACRSSVMIGDSLGKKEMQKILEHLAYLKSPWNCPHGRPTMRHLFDLTTTIQKPESE